MSGTEGRKDSAGKEFKIFIPYWGVLHLIQSIPDDADEESQSLKKACIKLLQGAPEAFMAQCRGSLVFLSPGEDFPAFDSSDLQAAAYLAKKLNQDVRGDMLSIAFATVNEGYLKQKGAIIMLPGLDPHEVLLPGTTKEKKEDARNRFFKSAVSSLGQGLVYTRETDGRFTLDPRYAPAGIPPCPPELFRFIPEEQRMAGIAHCIGSLEYHNPISVSWFKAQEKKEKEAAATGPFVFNWKKGEWYKRPEARAFEYQTTDEDWIHPQIILGVPPAGFRLRLENGLAILPEPHEISWLKPREEAPYQVEYEDWVIDLPEANAGFILKVLLLKDPIMGTVPIFYEHKSIGNLDPASPLSLSFDTSGTYISPEDALDGCIDSFIHYSSTNMKTQNPEDPAYNTQSLFLPVYFDGMHKHIVFWALANSPGLSEEPGFVKTEVRIDSKGLINFFIPTIAPGGLMIVDYMDAWARENNILDICSTTPEGALSICASRPASKSKAALPLAPIKNQLGLVREFSLHKYASATTLTDWMLEEAKKGTVWEVESPTAELEEMLSP